MRNGVKFRSALFFYLSAERARLCSEWKPEPTLRDEIVTAAKGNASRTFYIVSKKASLSVALKATAEPPLHL